MQPSINTFYSIVVRFTLTAVCISMIVCNSVNAQNDLLVPAPNLDTVLRFDAFTGELLGNFVTPGSIDEPQGIAIGPDNNVYVSSWGSDQIIRFDGVSGAFIDVFAETTGMTFPGEIAFNEGLLYVSNFDFVGDNDHVYRFNATTGAFVDLLADVGNPDGLEFDADGNIYVGSFDNDNVQRFSPDGTRQADFITPGLGGLDQALDVLFLDNGQMLVDSVADGSIKLYDSDGSFIDTVITGLVNPQGLAIGPDGNLYAGDFSLNVINRYDINTFELIDTFATPNTLQNVFVFRGASVPEPVGTGVLALLLLGPFGALRRGRSN